ncbi:MAG: sensor histidine kinase [Romboutsia sp.]|uniref:sensor histidine kinase n=1 Tax=Romboutsia sp. TaxID=1965302 RepID=UPI003F347AF4
MLENIIVNVIMAINTFLIIINHLDDDYIYNKNSSIGIILIAISLAMYITSHIKSLEEYKEKILSSNLIFLVLSIFINKLIILMLVPVIIEYFIIEKYEISFLAIILFIIFIFVFKLNLDYSSILTIIVVALFTYKTLSSQINENNLKNKNYELKEKIYKMEEQRKIEKKLNNQSLETIKIEERNIISQKLHDKIGHVLAGSIMNLEALKIVMDIDKEKSVIMLDNITDNLRNGMDDIRNTLRKIKPEQVELGHNNLKLILDDFTKSYNIDTTYSFKGDLNEINALYWSIIIESVKENLTNMIKYSNGNSINIDISVLNKIIRVYVKDNGICENKEIKKGMGLLGIEERVINVFGDVYFNNEDGFSTLIILKR